MTFSSYERSLIVKIRALYIAMLLLPSVCLAKSSPGEKLSPANLTHVIPDYRTSLASLPPDYLLQEEKQLSGVMLRRYNLSSQVWSPQGAVSPERWQNGVDIYIPDFARTQNALVVINNGTNRNASGSPVAPTNFSEDMLRRIAVATRTVVISVSNVPNQSLSYQGAPSPLTEDDSVAYSWKLFLSEPQKYRNASLHIPMAASVSQALRLAKKELTTQNINKFIVTGASKRGWAAWLTALSDPDVSAVVPLAMDLLNTRTSLEHIYHSYGKNWPLAFYPYYMQGIDRQTDTDAFASLMTLEDPLAYLNAGTAERLNIAKYIINASGDDFYVPDNSHFYYDRLPGVRSLRVVPNASHNGILSVAEQSLVSFVNRYQEKRKLPGITEKIQDTGGEGKTLTVSFSEKPSSVLQWTARNPDARDFRYACGIKYNATPVTPSASGETFRIPLTTPDNGWQATYIEATFSDGYVATTQVYITPDKYPETAPPSSGATCQTLPGRSSTAHQ